METYGNPGIWCFTVGKVGVIYIKGLKIKSNAQFAEAIITGCPPIKFKPTISGEDGAAIRWVLYSDCGSAEGHANVFALSNRYDDSPGYGSGMFMTW